MLDDIDSFLRFYFKNFSSDELNLFQTIIRSFCKNIDHSILFLSYFTIHIDVVNLCECWLTGGEESVTIDGFDMIIADLQLNKSDGTIVYVNKQLSVTTAQITLGDVYGIGVDFT